MDFEYIIAIIFWAGLGVALLIGAYRAGYNFASLRRPKWKDYIRVISVTGVITLIALIYQGTHTEYPEGYDGIFERGMVVMDFEPTLKERCIFGVKVFLFFTIPAFIGTYRRLRLEKRFKEIEKKTAGDA